MTRFIIDVFHGARPDEFPFIVFHHRVRIQTCFSGTQAYFFEKLVHWSRRICACQSRKRRIGGLTKFVDLRYVGRDQRPNNTRYFLVTVRLGERDEIDAGH